MPHARVCIAVVAAIAIAHAVPRAARAAEQRVYVRALPDRATFEAYSRPVGGDRYAKFVIDIDTGELYFFDVNLYRLHADFVLRYLRQTPWTEASLRAFNRNYQADKPGFILGSIVHHGQSDRYTFAFWEGDAIDAAGVARVYAALQRALFVNDLAFRPNSPAQERMARRVARRGIPVVTNHELYTSASFQPFHAGRAVGVLRVVPRGADPAALNLSRDDIALLADVVPDISPVAGILSARFSTPLAHVNLRARAWGIPNAGYVRALKEYRRLAGKVVTYEVTESGHTLRAATDDEIAAWKASRRDREKVALPPANLDESRMPMLTDIHRHQVTSFGAKTANLGEIAGAGIEAVNVPAGFGVPFSYYRDHLRRHGLDDRVRAMLGDARWSDPAWRTAELAALRDAIRAAPIDPHVLDRIYGRVLLRLGGRGVFVRSSTNAEDLAGFNGAGLYDTVPNVRGKQAIGEAVKQVWASLWNQRAVEEREMFGIDHRDVYAGVLVQVGVDASAAGVLVTANLFDPQDRDSFTINAKRGLGLRVVSGERIPEQVVYDTSNDGTKIISRSNDPIKLVFDDDGGIREVPNRHNGVILTEARARRLAGAVQAFLHLFPRGQPQDVEWLLDGETVWIVQCRPFVDPVDGGRQN